MFALEKEAKLSERYPGLWKAINLKESMGDRMITAYKYLRSLGLSSEEAEQDFEMIAVLSRWRDNRIIYRLDETLARELMDQAKNMADDDTLPGELLLRLPYAAIAIEGPGFQLVRRETEAGPVLSQIDLSGRFFIYTMDTGELGNAHASLCIQAEVADGSVHSYYLPICDTIASSVAALHAEWQKAMPELRGTSQIDEAYLEALPVLYAAQLVLYLQAENTDIQRKPSAAPIRRAGKPAQKAAKEFTVGLRVGAAIRRAEATHAEATGASRRGGSHAAPRPHSRRGHWHHFWTGPKDGERKLILKWINPLMVGVGDLKNTTTIYPIRSGKNRNKGER